MEESSQFTHFGHHDKDIIALCDLVDEYRTEIVYASEELVTLADELALANSQTEVQKKKLTVSNALVVDLEDSICILDDELVELRSVVETVMTLLTIQAPDKDLIEGLRLVLSIDEDDISEDTEISRSDEIEAITSAQENKFILKYKAIIRAQLSEIAGLKEKIKVLEKQKDNRATMNRSLEYSPLRDRIPQREEEKQKSSPGRRSPVRENIEKEHHSENHRKESKSNDLTPHAPPGGPSDNSPSSSSLDNSFDRGRSRNKDSPKKVPKNIPHKIAKISITAPEVRDSETVDEEEESDTEDEDEEMDKDITISLPYRRGSKGDMSNALNSNSTSTSATGERRASKSSNYPEMALSPTARMKYDGVVKSSRRASASENSEKFEKPIGTQDRSSFDAKLLEKQLIREIDVIEKEKERGVEREKRRKRDSIPLPDKHKEKEKDKDNAPWHKEYDVHREAKIREREKEREREREKERDRERDENRERETDRDTEWELEREGDEDSYREPEESSRGGEGGGGSISVNDVPVTRARARKGTRGNAAITDALRRVRAGIITTRGPHTHTPSSSSSSGNDHGVKVRSLRVTGEDDRNPLSALQIKEYRNSKNIDNETEVRAREQQYLHQQWLETSSNSPPRSALHRSSSSSSSSSPVNVNQHVNQSANINLSQSQNQNQNLTPLSPPNPLSLKATRPLHFSRPVLRMDSENAFFDVTDLRHSVLRTCHNNNINGTSEYSNTENSPISNMSSYRNGKSASHGM